MPLTPGTRLGLYEVTALIGEGGMGEVYRARDRKLDRDVAIKILPDAVAADPERIARFEREAKTLAALNHPNIAHIYGVEESDGTRALVMELVQGSTLAHRIAQGPIPVDEALPIAKQIADALEAAHEQGIIHRDLKPANITVRADGVVKVLDFGLAKAMEPAGAISAGTSMSPTITSPAMTQSGTILGTAAYMSPEQARGKTADRRADVWAFGAVLFEMLTGKRAFPGEDITDTIVSVVSKEPDWRTLPAATPASLRRLLARSLKKDPRARLQAIGDARVQIEELLSGAPDETVAAPGVPAPVPAAWPRSAWSRALPWTLAASTLVFAITTVLLWAPWRVASPSPTALRSTPFAFEQGGQRNPVWAPDAKAVAFAARQKNTDPFQIYVRYLDSPLATPITDLAVNAIPIDWTATGRIVFQSAQPPAGLWSVAPVGGEPQPFQTMEGSVGPASEAATASVSRGGSALAWLHRGDDGLIGVWISSPPGSAPKRYEPAPFAARSGVSTPTVKFSPDGTQILLIRDAGAGDEAWLMPYPANAANPPHRILQNLPLGGTTFSWMPDKRHVVLSAGQGLEPLKLYIADTISDAFSVLLSGMMTVQRSPAVSPVGRKLVTVEAITDFDIVSLNLATAVVTPLIATKRSENQPAWATRESAMVYVTDRSGLDEIWMHKPGQLDRPLVSRRDFPPDTTTSLAAPILSPEATRVIYMRLERAGPGRLWISAVSGGSPVQLVKGSAERERAGSWSPDGKWFVYLHAEKGRSSLNKVQTTGQAEPEVLKADINPVTPWLPVWSPAGDWILYEDDRAVKLISPDGKTSRHLSSTSAVAYTFSADGRTIYGIRRAAADRLELFSMRVAGGTEKTIGSFGLEHVPATQGGPATRLSLTPDGKSITFSTSKTSSNLWLIELNGVTPP